MKKITTFLIPLFLLISLASIEESKACINTDTTVIIIVNYEDSIDNPFITEIELRLTNLRFMNESPNKVCSCALTQFSDMFTNLQYVAFVDSGTNNPYQNFAAFVDDANATSAWNTSLPSNNWSGFIADVINAGLDATDPVEMVIRASTPPGTRYTLFGDSVLLAESLMQAVEGESLGTDEWDPISQDLVESHQTVRRFDPASGSSVSYSLKNYSYFTNLDNDILNNIPTGIRKTDKDQVFGIYPNPFTDMIRLNWFAQNEQNVELRLLNALGQMVYQKNKAVQPNSLQQLDLNVDGAALEAGLYLLQIITPERQVVVKMQH